MSLDRRSEKTVASKKYYRHLERAKNTSNYFTFCRLYAKIMSKLNALFLQDLTNLSSSPNAKLMKHNGVHFFQCAESFLRDSQIGWSVDEQRQHLKVLQDKGFIIVERMGMPATRWVWINYEAIDGALDSTIDADPQLREKSRDKQREKSRDKQREKSRDKMREISRVNTNYKKREKEKRLRRPLADGRRPPFSPLVNGNGHVDEVIPPTQIPEDREHAIKLRNMVTKVHRVRIYGKTSRWSERIAILRRQLKDDQKRLNSVLRWYCKNPETDEKLPIVCSEKGINLKWLIWVEDIMKRHLKKRGETAETEMEEIRNGDYVTLKASRTNRFANERVIS